MTETDTKELSLQDEFDVQLADFVLDTSEQDVYARFTPLKEEVLVKLFKFIPSEKKASFGTSEILIPSALNGEWTTQKVAKHSKIYPICKVIKKGRKASPDITVGSVYTVPVSDIIGDDMNPEFMWLIQNFNQQGKKGSMTKLPEGMRQRIPKLEKNWDRYKFSLPDRIGEETDEDRLVYLVPELKLDAEYELTGAVNAKLNGH